MTTVVYLGNRIIADTRATIQEEGYVSENGEKQLLNDQTVKCRTFDPGYMWDEERDIRLIGCSGTMGGIRKFVAFMKLLRCPMEQFILTLGVRDSGLLWKIIGLEKPSSFILCLNTGESIRLSITPKTHIYKGPDKKIKAVGSGAFYFDALKDVFDVDPETIFRIAINTDKYSSKDTFVEGVYDPEKQTWTLDPEPFKYTHPLDPEVLVNGFNPHVKAILKGALDIITTLPEEAPSENPEVEDHIPVKIPTVKKG